jgi:hypothetical protein
MTTQLPPSPITERLRAALEGRQLLNDIVAEHEAKPAKPVTEGMRSVSTANLRELREALTGEPTAPRVDLGKLRDALVG